MKIQISLSDEQEEKHQKTLEETGFWGRQAAGCLFLARSTGRLLFANRSKHVLEPNTWGMWGGALDDGETPVHAVTREIVEEAQFHGKVKLVALSVFSHQSGFRYHNFLAVVDDEFKPVLNWETQGYSWVEFGAWPKPLHQGVAIALKLQSNIQKLKLEIQNGL